ncbi:DsbA family protein [Mesobacillus zeae]
MPFELRPLPHETHSPKSEYIQSGWNSSIKPMAERFGVKMELPMHLDPMPHTHLAHEGFQFAKTEGLGNEYAEAVLQEFWENGKNIGDIETLGSIAEAVGLDRKKFEAALKNRSFEQRHKETLRHAYEEAQITAVPTIFIGSRRVQGLHTKEMLEKIIGQEAEDDSPNTGDSCGIDGC